MESVAPGADKPVSIAKRSTDNNASNEDILNSISLLGMYEDNFSAGY